MTIFTSKVKDYGHGTSKPIRKIKISGRAQRESARRRKSDWGQIQVLEIPLVAKSRSLNSNALAYAERALST